MNSKIRPGKNTGLHPDMLIKEYNKNIDIYLKRYAWPTLLIQSNPATNLSLSVIIPAFEEPDLLKTLIELRENEYPGSDVEVMVIINQSEVCNEKTREANRESFEAARQFANEPCPDWLKFHIQWVKELPAKHAGVGLARKIGMDEALRRISASGNDKNGILICLDADCLIEKNYLKTIADHFRRNPQSPGCSINFKHQPAENSQIQSAIDAYELHLRYHVHALRYCRFPHAYYTIGSSMACRAEAYAQAGGMNRRKAGEDFYFLHKIIPMGGFTEIRETTVYPSPRPSHRVPFGTGRAVSKKLMQDGPFKTYSWKSFEPLRRFLALVPDLRQMTAVEISEALDALPEPVSKFLNNLDADQQIQRIIEKTNRPESYTKAFYQWFTGFAVLKYLHFIRDHFYEEEPIEVAASTLLEVSGIASGKNTDISSLLFSFRNMDNVL
ncbi:MAG: glycosyltransferase [Cyclobacteriaceae bacterium]|nr:glycosyltransferase [Cyclobacteriaceae bacterium]